MPTKTYFYLMVFIGFCLTALTSCSSDEGYDIISDENPDEKLTGFQGPTYPDDYTDVAAWSSRDKWNLANVHDPSVEKDGEYFYMYSTDASYGNAHEGNGHYLVRRSKDLVNWDFQGTIFPEAPKWIKDSLNNIRARMSPPLDPIEEPEYGFWAPNVRKVGNIFRLYYSVVVRNPIVGNDPNQYWTERAFIGLAETDDLASNKWNDKGMVISSIADKEDDYKREGADDWKGYFKFNAIDPSFIETLEGKQWLVYGSWHSGIAIVSLEPQTGKPYKLDKVADYGERIAGRGNVDSNRWQGLEAPEIVYNEDTGYFYLFMAYDELSVAYNTRVARSRNITGPYKGIDGANVTDGAEAWPMLTHPYVFDDHPGWVGISHPAIFKDPVSDQWFYASQGRLPEGVPGIGVSNAIMMGHIRKIEWTEDGWPLVSAERYANVPQKEIQEKDIIGTWEVINLEYEYRHINESHEVKLIGDFSTSGESSGEWSYHEDKHTLSYNGNEVLVSWAWDWEAHPRKEILTFVGFMDKRHVIWGKKIK